MSKQYLILEYYIKYLLKLLYVILFSLQYGIYTNSLIFDSMVYVILVHLDIICHLIKLNAILFVQQDNSIIILQKFYFICFI